jgi:hypothetical protein
MVNRLRQNKIALGLFMEAQRTTCSFVKLTVSYLELLTIHHRRAGGYCKEGQHLVALMTYVS